MAAPYPAPRISQYSEDIWAVGGNSGCRGAIHVGISVDRTKPGKAFITYTPRPFVGDGPEWRRNPVCKISVTPVVDFRVNGARQVIVGEPRGGKQVRQTLRPGSGFHVLSFVGDGAAFPTSNYTLIP